jgi:hypothetical protein
LECGVSTPLSFFAGTGASKESGVETPHSKTPAPLPFSFPKATPAKKGAL